MVGKEERTWSEGGPDLEGGEVLEQRLKLEAGELRPPAAAGLLVQSVDQEDQALTTLLASVITLFSCILAQTGMKSGRGSNRETVKRCT